MKIEVIPFKDFKDKNRKVNEELDKGKYVEVWSNLKVIYSADKGGGRNKPR